MGADRVPSNTIIHHIQDHKSTHGCDLQIDLSRGLGDDVDVVTFAISDTTTGAFTPEDIEYAREKYTSQGFDYEAAKAPEAQKKVVSCV